MGEETNFGWALRLLKEGKQVYRKGWHGVDMGMIMYLALQTPDQHSKMTEQYIYITIRKEMGPPSLLPWIASQKDLLANDWEVYK